MHRFAFLSLYQACRTRNWLRVKSEVQLGTLGCHVLDVSKMLGHTLRVSSLHQNKYLSMFAFQVQSPRSDRLSSLDFNLWGHLKSLVYSARIGNEETLFQSVFYACQTIRNLPWNFARVPMRTQVQVEDILSVFLFVIFDLMHSKNSTPIKL